jgi:NTE family protein
LTALVLSAGGMFAAWEAGVWKVLHRVLRPDVFIGASAGAWNAWLLASGMTPEELEREWLDPSSHNLLRFGPHRAGFLSPEPLHRKAKELANRFHPRFPVAITMVEVPRMRLRLVRDGEITWRHLAASCSIPLCFPPVEIEGRRYVDGGLMGALPVWAADELGASRAIAVNAWNKLPFRILHGAIARRHSSSLEVIRINPSRNLGSLISSLRWNERNIREWIRLGEEDANRWANSITM